MKKYFFILFYLLLSVNVFSQSLKDITAAGINFFLNSDKARYLSHDQRTGLSILKNLLKKQSDREHEINVAREQGTHINIAGVTQEIKILPGSDGGFYLVTNDKVYPITGELLRQIRGYSSGESNQVNYSPANNNTQENINLSKNYLSKSVSFLNAGNYELSKLNAQKALSLNPKNLRAKMIIGASQVNLEYYDKGLSILNEYLEEKPDDNSVHFFIGFAYFKKGEFDKAISFFSNAIALNKEDFKSYLILAMSYEKENDKTNSLKYYKKYLELDPSQTVSKKYFNMDVRKKISSWNSIK